MASLNLEDFMANTRSNQQPKSKGQLSRRTPNRNSAKTPKSTSPNTKHAKIIALLGSSAGATIAALIKATGWQQRSVRGFLAGVVRKKLKHNLVSEREADNDRVYRIVKCRTSKTSSIQANAA